MYADKNSLEDRRIKFNFEYKGKPQAIREWLEKFDDCSPSCFVYDPNKEYEDDEDYMDPEDRAEQEEYEDDECPF